MAMSATPIWSVFAMIYGNFKSEFLEGSGFLEKLRNARFLTDKEGSVSGHSNKWFTGNCLDVIFLFLFIFI